MRKSHNNNDLNQPLFEVEMGVAMEPSEHRRAGDAGAADRAGAAGSHGGDGRWRRRTA